MGSKDSLTRERFWAKVLKTDSCWEWIGYKQPKGYGVFRFHGSAKLAHRVAYELERGPIADGIEIDHKCHNRGCVNPEHLRAVTHKQNMENYSGVYASNKTSGIRGVSWHKQHRKWCATVTHDKRRIHVGLFQNLKEAEAAVVAKRLELFTHNEVDRRTQLEEPLRLGEILEQLFT